jgi:hypothetical protein
MVASLSNGTYLRLVWDDPETAHRGRFALPINELQGTVGRGVSPSRGLNLAPFASLSDGCYNRVFSEVLSFILSSIVEVTRCLSM